MGHEIMLAKIHADPGKFLCLNCAVTVARQYWRGQIPANCVKSRLTSGLITGEVIGPRTMIICCCCLGSQAFDVILFCQRRVKPSIASIALGCLMVILCQSVVPIHFLWLVEGKHCIEQTYTLFDLFITWGSKLLIVIWAEKKT